VVVCVESESRILCVEGVDEAKEGEKESRSEVSVEVGVEEVEG